jgi:hypothetical protein
VKFHGPDSIEGSHSCKTFVALYCNRKKKSDQQKSAEQGHGKEEAVLIPARVTALSLIEHGSHVKNKVPLLFDNGRP